MGKNRKNENKINGFFNKNCFPAFGEQRKKTN
jgi:hypothetical protein